MWLHSLAADVLAVLAVVAAVVAVAALYYYSQGFSSPLVGMSNANKAAEAVDNAPSSCAAGGNNFVPASPMGQNAGEAAADRMDRHLRSSRSSS